MRVETKGRHGTVKGKTETNWAELTCLPDSNHRADKENHFLPSCMFVT